MKFTHNAVTSITVEKVENITTSMTRAGLGDDTYRRQRDKERYMKFKAEQAERDQKMRQQFLNLRTQKLKTSQALTLKKSLKRQKKKERQKQLKKKAKLLQKLQEGEEEESQSSQQQRWIRENPNVLSVNEKIQQQEAKEQCKQE